MPKVTLCRTDKIKRGINHLIDNGCYDSGLTQQELEVKMGMQHTTFWRKKKTASFTVEELAKIFDTFHASDEQILEVFRR